MGYGHIGHLTRALGTHDIVNEDECGMLASREKKNFVGFLNASQAKCMEYGKNIFIPRFFRDFFLHA